SRPHANLSLNTAVIRGCRPSHPVVIFENDRGQWWYVCGQARYVREPPRRAPSLLCARRGRDDGPPDGDDARRRGGKRPPCGDAHSPDASVSAPFTVLLPEGEPS